MIVLKLRLAFVVMFAACTALFAQPKDEVGFPPKDEVGMVLSAALNIHNASFSRLGDVPSCCPEFTSTAGFGTSAGLFYTYALNTTWRLQGRVTYSDRSATLTDTERSFVADLRDSAKVIEALFTHEIAASITDVGFEPLVLFRPFGKLDLMFGGRVAIPIVSTFRQTETLTEPADYGTFLGAGRVRVDASDDIPGFVSPQISVVFGLRYFIPLRTNGVTFLAPELQFSAPLTQISDGTTWSVSHLRLGIAFGFANPPRPSAPDPSTPDPADTASPAPPAIVTLPSAPAAVPPRTPSARVVVKGIATDGRESDAVTVRVEEIATTEIVPLQPHVYFDSASTTWIAEQRASRDAFDKDAEGMDLETGIHAGPWLFAKRLANNPGATARLIGTTSEDGSDKGLTLARERAQSVKDVFVRRGVNAAALTIEARRLPTKPTVASDSSQSALAAAENRRVEFEVSDPLLLAPFTLRSTEKTIDVPSMRAYLQTTNVDSVAAWTVSVRQGAQKIASFSGTRTVPPYVEWNLADSGIPTTEAPLEVSLVIDGTQRLFAADSVAVSQLTIRNKRVQRIAGREIERFNLLLFDFNDARVGAENAKLIAEVRSKITSRTEVTVYGLTDEMGAAEYNKDLSTRRAAEVAAILNVPQARIVGIGESSLKYRSKTPVARGFNRTVVIELVTPVP